MREEEEEGERRCRPQTSLASDADTDCERDTETEVDILWSLEALSIKSSIGSYSALLKSLSLLRDKFKCAKSPW